MRWWQPEAGLHRRTESGLRAGPRDEGHPRDRALGDEAAVGVHDEEAAVAFEPEVIDDGGGDRRAAERLHRIEKEGGNADHRGTWLRSTTGRPLITGPVISRGDGAGGVEDGFAGALHVVGVRAGFLAALPGEVGEDGIEFGNGGNGPR